MSQPRYYRDAGVDIHAGYDVVKRIKKHVETTKVPGVLGNVGSFFSLFQPDFKG
jgi:phosphoribosylformylglycinamidine cyclo-ligase